MEHIDIVAALYTQYPHLKEDADKQREELNLGEQTVREALEMAAEGQETVRREVKRQEGIARRRTTAGNLKTIKGQLKEVNEDETPTV